MRKGYYRNYCKNIPKTTIYGWNKKNLYKNVAKIAESPNINNCTSSSLLNRNTHETMTSHHFDYPENNNCTNTTIQLVEAILTIFFKGHLTQTAANYIIELINIVSAVKIPANFNSCLKFLENNSTYTPIKYNKRRFCDTCNKIECEIKRYQRQCNKCSSRYTVFKFETINLSLFFFVVDYQCTLICRLLNSFVIL
jgi:hypothetical protein